MSIAEHARARSCGSMPVVTAQRWSPASRYRRCACRQGVPETDAWPIVHRRRRQAIPTSQDPCRCRCSRLSGHRQRQSSRGNHSLHRTEASTSFHEHCRLDIHRGQEVTFLIYIVYIMGPGGFWYDHSVSQATATPPLRQQSSSS